MNMIVRYGLALTVLATLLVGNARAEDPIAAWNQISETAVKTAGHPPPVAALDFAIVHLAIYDAVESIDRRYEPYYTLVPHATGSLNAAAAKAGHDVLVGLFPEQGATLDAAYVNYVTANGINPLDPGTAVGSWQRQIFWHYARTTAASPSIHRLSSAARKSASGGQRRRCCRGRRPRRRRGLLLGWPSSHHSRSKAAHNSVLTRHLI